MYQFIDINIIKYPIILISSLKIFQKSIEFHDEIYLSMCKLCILIKIFPLIQSSIYQLNQHNQDRFFNFLPRISLDQNFIVSLHAFIEFFWFVLVVFIRCQLICKLVEGMGLGMGLLVFSRQKVDIVLFEEFLLNWVQANIFAKNTHLKMRR